MKREKLGNSFQISRWKKMRVNPSLKMKNKKQLKHPKTYGIILENHKIGGIELDRKYAQKMSAGKYVAISKLEETVDTLLVERKLGIFHFSKSLGAIHTNNISSVMIEESKMSAAANPIKIKHFDTEQQVDGSAFRYYENGCDYRLAPGEYISVKDLKKCINTHLEVDLPIFMKRGMEKLKGVKNTIGSWLKNKKKADKIEEQEKKVENQSSWKDKIIYCTNSNKLLTKMKLSKKKVLAIGSAIMLAGSISMVSSFSEEKKQNPIIKTNIVEKIAIDTIEEKAPLQIGDAVTIHENASYYVDASLAGEPVYTYNDYVDSDDYNIISAIAIIDASGNLVKTSYNTATTIDEFNSEATMLGDGYQVVVHYGPMNEVVDADINPYNLGWSDLSSIHESKDHTKTYSKTLW